jgi:hypothetical protein
VPVNEKKWLVMHMHVQLKLDEHGCGGVLAAGQEPTLQQVWQQWWPQQHHTAGDDCKAERLVDALHRLRC